MKMTISFLFKHYKLIILTFFQLFIIESTAGIKAAEKISLISGGFIRSIEVSNIEHLAKTGEATGFLAEVIKMSNQNPNEVRELLKQDVELPLVLSTKLMKSKIGEVILGRVAKIIHPVKVTKTSIGVSAIRSGVIKGLAEGNGRINTLLFIKSYPNKTMAINVPALLKVVNKVESIKDLMEFFSDSPLEDL